MLSLDGCESPDNCLTLHRETKLRWNKGILHEIRLLTCAQSSSPMRIANPPSIWLTSAASCTILGYNVLCKSARSLVNAPVRILSKPCQWFRFKTAWNMDIASSITKLRTSRLYTRKALADKANIDLRHLIAVEEGRALPTDYDIEAISRVFHVKPSDWIKWYGRVLSQNQASGETQR